MTSKPTELVIGDPHDQPGLVDHIPPGVSPVQIVNFYHYPFWPDNKAYCAKCAARRHRDGFTVELDNGTFVLAGSTCGSDLWSERWSAVRKSFQDKLHKAGIILDVRDVLSELESIRAAFEASWQPVVGRLDAHQKRFKNAMAPLHKALLRLDRDFDGRAYFETDNVGERFRLALDQIDIAIAAGHGQETELGVRTVNIGEARDRLDAVAHAARGMRNFFTQYYLPSIVDSANAAIGENRYSVNGQSVMDDYTQVSIGLPADYPVLNTEPLRRLRDLKSTG
jgi:hypothetical protein